MVQYRLRYPFLLLLLAALLSSLVWWWQPQVILTATALFQPQKVNFQDIKLKPGQRLLIIAPHPDDEILATGGLIAQARELKLPVRIVVVTLGDSFLRACQKVSGTEQPGPEDFFRLGQLRWRESRQGLRQLGLDPDRQAVYLGFPDGGLRFLWEEFWQKPRVSGGVRTDKVPYSQARQPGLTYTGENLLLSLQAEITAFQPTDIFYPTPSDEHPDHWAVGTFTEIALRELQLPVRRHTYLVHHVAWPALWAADQNREAEPPPQLTRPENLWERLELDDQARKSKAAALAAHQSQLAVMAPYLKGFIRASEIFLAWQEHQLPFAVADGELDHVKTRLLPGEDISSLKIEAAPSGLTAELELYGHSRPDRTYRLYLWLYRNQKPLAHLRISAEKAEVLWAAAGCQTDTKKVPFQQKEKGLVWQLPPELTAGADRALVSAMTGPPGQIRDKTGWYWLKLN